MQDDAHARWRALHEMSVVSHFISEKGQDIAERYLLHDTVQRYKLALKHREYRERLNEQPISQEEFDELKAEHDKLVERFGRSFKEEYGWAASALGKGRPTIWDIEESVALEHLRPYYRMASANVHANAHGVYYRLGANPLTSEMLLAGPSIFGLAEPGRLNGDFTWSSYHGTAHDRAYSGQHSHLEDSYDISGRGRRSVSSGT